MKRMVSWLCLAVLCLCLSAPASAEPLTPERECSLTLQYAKEGVAFAGEKIHLYRVAEAFPDGTFEKVAPFTTYEVSIHSITDAKGWSNLATTLSDYVVADAIAPTATGTTDDKGKAVFADLSTGLYLVDGVMTRNDSGTYTFDPFMVYLPTDQEDTYDYDVEAKPKADHFEPAPEGTEYRVLKLWEDMAALDARPASVSMEIFKDGVFWKTVTLSDQNNWSYAWTDSGQSRWTVVERDVPDGYTVFEDKNGTTFMFTNQWSPDTPEPPVDPPQTGDTTPIWLYVLVLCLSGSGCVIVGLALMRGKRHEKRQ